MHTHDDQIYFLILRDRQDLTIRFSKTQPCRRLAPVTLLVGDQGVDLMLGLFFDLMTVLKNVERPSGEQLGIRWALEHAEDHDVRVRLLRDRQCEPQRGHRRFREIDRAQ